MYNQNQVRIMIKEGDTFDEIPDFEKVFDTQVSEFVSVSEM